MIVIDPRFTKPVSGFLYVNEENEIPISLSGSDISLTLCNRTNISNNLGNYFMSLNLPTSESKFPKNSSMSFFFPELQQLNVDNILLIKIPATAYTEFIDARSVKLNLPATGGTSNFYTLFSSTYNDSDADKYGETSPLLGDNIAYLFSDSVNLPYTGFSVSQVGQLVSNSITRSWNPVSRDYRDRPSATAYSEVKQSINSINTDRRYRINKSVFIDGLYPDFRGQAIGYYSTISSGGNVGFVVLPDRNYFQVGDYVTVDQFDHSLNPSYSGNVQITSILENQSYSNLYYAPENYNGLYDVIITNLTYVNSTTDESGILYISGGTYYNYDIPVGFVVLDKGLIAITDSDIVNSIDWYSGNLPDGSPNISGETSNIHFTGVSTSIYGNSEPEFLLDFTSLDTVFKLRATCNSLYGEFYISSNSTWNTLAAVNQLSTNQKVAITEVGLYNDLNELVALAKFSEPVYKGLSDVITFELDINI